MCSIKLAFSLNRRNIHWRVQELELIVHPSFFNNISLFVKQCMSHITYNISNITISIHTNKPVHTICKKIWEY